MKKIVFLFLLTSLLSCNDEVKINVNIEGKAQQNKEATAIVKNLNNSSIDKIAILIDGKSLKEIPYNNKINFTLNNEFKLGAHQLQCDFKKDNEVIASKKLNFELFSGISPKLLKYKLINTYPHDATAFVQGYEFYKDTLYEGTGLNGVSDIRKVDYKTTKIYQQHKLKRRYFGEGITILNDKVYQLTWQSGKVFVYNTNLDSIGAFKLNHTSEGWGMCNDGQKIYQSDGSEKIWMINPESFKEEDYINIYTNKHKIVKINELEWVNGKIYSNVWMKNAVAIINPKTGAVENIINFSELVKQIKIPPQNIHDYVLNGIAYNPRNKHLYITGKRWDKTFEIEIIQP